MEWKIECLRVVDFDNGFGELGEFGMFGEWADRPVSGWWRLEVAVRLDFVSVDVVSCLVWFVVVVVLREALQHLDPCAPSR